MLQSHGKLIVLIVPFLSSPLVMKGQRMELIRLFGLRERPCYIFPWSVVTTEELHYIWKNINFPNLVNDIVGAGTVSMVLWTNLPKCREPGVCKSKAKDNVELLILIAGYKKIFLGKKITFRGLCTQFTYQLCLRATHFTCRRMTESIFLPNMSDRKRLVHCPCRCEAQKRTQTCTSICWRTEGKCADLSQGRGGTLSFLSMSIVRASKNSTMESA